MGADGATRGIAVHDAFVRGDLAALRAALADPVVVPHGTLPHGMGSCLVYAIFHSPLTFIRTLLDLGADPNAPADDGFPPLVAALTMSRSQPGAPAREDVDDLLRLLLARGADPNQRGINDWTALHVAVTERNPLAVYRLLEHGADPSLATRIDDCETPLDLARASGQPALAELIAARGRPQPTSLRTGLLCLVDLPGEGPVVQRQHDYTLRLRMRVADGDWVVWPAAWGPVGQAELHDVGATLITRARINRGQLMNGLFYGLDGMRVGGTRVLEVAPPLAYGSRGVPGVVPPGARLIVEVTVLAAAV